MQYLYLGCFFVLLITLFYRMFWYEVPEQESTEWFGNPGNYPW